MQTLAMKVKFALINKTNGRQRFNIVLTDRSKKRLIAYDVPFSVSDWDIKKQTLIPVSTKAGEKYKTYRRNSDWVEDTIKLYQKAIDSLIALDKPFFFDTVVKAVNNPQKVITTVHELWESRIKEFDDNEQYKTAEGYRGTLNKFKKFKSKDMTFTELDAELVKTFKASMKDLANATTHIHLRNVRAIYNLAIKKNIAKSEHYPFRDDEIFAELPEVKRTISISKTDVENLRAFRLKQVVGSDEWHACNYFLFGYLGRGINFQDIARLEWSHVSRGRIKFTRRKTRSKVGTEMSFPVTAELAEILSWYRRNNTQLHNPYIMPVLKPNHTAEKQKKSRIEMIRKEVNATLRGIGVELGFAVKLTTYVWRHSFASIAKNELGVDIAMISEMLGHQDLETTQAYLRQFPDEYKDKAVEGL